VERLRWDMLVDAAQIGVRVDGDHVNLKGRVGTVAERRRAYDLAWVRGVDAVNASEPRAAEQTTLDTVGVVRVRSRLVLSPDEVAARALERDVLQALAINSRTTGYPITAEAYGGLVVLRGPVGSHFDKAIAEDVTAAIAGVHEVDNELSVQRGMLPYVRNPYLYPYEPLGPERVAAARPLRADAEIAETVARKLQASPFVDADRVRVCVEHGTAVLTGFARSHREYVSAARHALEAGAVSVDNRLELR
jgi:osmotically-inducible protein OsmY